MNRNNEPFFEEKRVKKIRWQTVHENDPNFSFKRGSSGAFTTVTKATDGTSICDANDNRLPLVAKIVKGSEVLFMVQDPGANEGTITKIKVSHFQKSFFISANSDEPKLYKFTV